ncbi:MAG: hypothetical protein ABR548_11960 [Actinomycetota bacterium]|nr:hypothetical protein [Actinomycetota bacterium]
MKLRIVLVVALLSAVFPGGVAHPLCASAQSSGTSRAGLLVEYPNSETQFYCVSFSGRSITGLELLRKTGVALAYQDFGGGNVTVCSIGGRGCPYPKTPCFCQCATGAKTCTFWGYYKISHGTNTWQFSQEGAGVSVVRNGEINGWRWGAHGVQGTHPPAATTLEEICATGVHVSVAGARVARTSKRPAAVIAVLALLVMAAGYSFQRRRNEALDA